MECSQSSHDSPSRDLNVETEFAVYSQESRSSRHSESNESFVTRLGEANDVFFTGRVTCAPWGFAQATIDRMLIRL